METKKKTNKKQQQQKNHTLQLDNGSFGFTETLPYGKVVYHMASDHSTRIQTGLRMQLGLSSTCVNKRPFSVNILLQQSTNLFSFLGLISSRKYTYIVLTLLNPWDLQGYTLLFLFLLKNVDCRYSLEPARRCGFNEYPQYVEQKYEKYQIFF